MLIKKISTKLQLKILYHFFKYKVVFLIKNRNLKIYRFFFLTRFRIAQHNAGIIAIVRGASGTFAENSSFFLFNASLKHQWRYFCSKSATSLLKKSHFLKKVVRLRSWCFLVKKYRHKTIDFRNARI